MSDLWTTFDIKRSKETVTRSTYMSVIASVSNVVLHGYASYGKIFKIMFR